MAYNQMTWDYGLLVKAAAAAVAAAEKLHFNDRHSMLIPNYTFVDTKRYKIVHFIALELDAIFVNWFNHPNLRISI